MNDQISVLVLGIDETASAVARMLLLAGYAVAMHQPAPPKTLCRKMAFADAWHDGATSLDGVQARRADLSSDFLTGLRTRLYIPILVQSFSDTGRWAWDVIADAKPVDERWEPIASRAELTIGLGPGRVAGSDCDLVIETSGPNPGAIFERHRTRSSSGRVRRGTGGHSPCLRAGNRVVQNRPDHWREHYKERASRTYGRCAGTFCSRRTHSRTAAQWARRYCRRSGGRGRYPRYGAGQRLRELRSTHRARRRFCH